MRAFPPAPGERVTLHNWQDPPYNRWSFSHVRELVPTQRIARAAGPVTPLPADPQPLGDLPVACDRQVSSLDAVLDDTYTDGLVVVHDGRVVVERYAGETGPRTPHLLMSVTKSIVSCVVAVLVERGALAVDDLVTDHVPELGASGYRGARLRDLLDMRSGIRFSEVYTDLDAEVRVLEQAVLWRPRTGDEVPDSMYTFLAALKAAREHGGVFEYRSCETDVLGWVCERAAGRRMADLVSEPLWVPLGAEHDAEVTCDALGAAMHDGGICATTLDLARFGTMLLDGGRSGGTQVVPAGWLTDAWNAGPALRSAFAASTSERRFPGGWYRNQFWFVPRPHGVVLLCLGINGQMVYVDPTTGTVAAKVSSWPVAQSAMMLNDTLTAFDAVGTALEAR